MLVYKCKICGGNLDIKDGDKLTTCPYCGSVQTIPNLDDEKVNKLFERGNELVRNCQFDDAVEKFEEILSIKNDDPEVYWSLLMAKFGVVYEKDPYTGNMLPTIHRNQDISVFLDEDYKLTIQYSNDSQRQYYEKTAGLIDRIQKKYNAICDKEEPFDIFICYKQTNDKTKKDTEDYKIAYDLYTSLTNEGYRVFFSHITLEDKIGEEYEPYIYAALKSSKVLLALGTKKEYYNAIWVKNEWSRFMHMMKDDHSKRLIPICDKSTSLPLEFSRYQAIQMNNSIVWKEDLIRNIGKIFANNNSNETIIKSKKTNTHSSLINLKEDDEDSIKKYDREVLKEKYKNSPKRKEVIKFVLICTSMFLIPVLIGLLKVNLFSGVVEDASENIASDVVLITDGSDLYDNGINESTYKGIIEYSDNMGVLFNYIVPDISTTEEYINRINESIARGANTIICCGYQMADAVSEMQFACPDVNFICVDFQPINIQTNCASIFFEVQESGFLAGYAVVKDGYTKLGFDGAMAIPEVVNYGYGFLAGAQYAAEELGLADGAIEVMYSYTGEFAEKPEYVTNDVAWYTAGTEVIFGCGSPRNAFQAAEQFNAACGDKVRVIGVDYDCSKQSNCVLTSAIKCPQNVIKELLEWSRDYSLGGNVDTYGIERDACGLTIDNSRFRTFTFDDYNIIYRTLVEDYSLRDSIPTSSDYYDVNEYVVSGRLSKLMVNY